MAYLTLSNVDLDPAQQTSLNSYISSETTAGNTDGVKIAVTRNGVNIAGTPGERPEPWSLTQRAWKDSASANAYLSYLTSLGGTVNYAVAVNPL